MCSVVLVHSQSPRYAATVEMKRNRPLENIARWASEPVARLVIAKIAEESIMNDSEHTLKIQRWANTETDT